MAEPLRHRQTKEAATDMLSLQPPRHISTLPRRFGCLPLTSGLHPINRHSQVSEHFSNVRHRSNSTLGRDLKIVGIVLQLAFRDSHFVSHVNRTS